jgi:hypothetical protein
MTLMMKSHSRFKFMADKPPTQWNHKTVAIIATTVLLTLVLTGLGALGLYRDELDTVLSLGRQIALLLTGALVAVLGSRS